MPWRGGDGSRAPVGLKKRQGGECGGEGQRAIVGSVTSDTCTTRGRWVQGKQRGRYDDGEGSRWIFVSTTGSWAHCAELWWRRTQYRIAPQWPAPLFVLLPPGRAGPSGRGWRPRASRTAAGRQCGAPPARRLVCGDRAARRGTKGEHTTPAPATRARASAPHPTRPLPLCAARYTPLTPSPNGPQRPLLQRRVHCVVVRRSADQRTAGAGAIRKRSPAHPPTQSPAIPVPP